MQKPQPYETALNLINSLSEENKQAACYALKDSNSTKWHYLPWSSYERPGIPLKILTATQKENVNQLLQFFLSKKGYEKTQAIIALEDILSVIENNPTKRDKEQYYLSFYGEPSPEAPWAFHFQGHHVSLNFTVIKDKVAYTPRFFGANPAKVLSGPQKGLRVLKAEEDLAFELVNGLTANQKQKAVFEDKSFWDIQSTNLPDVSSSIPALESIMGKGLPLKEMNVEQQTLLLNLIGEYISAVPENVAKERMETIKKEEMDNIAFGWTGATEPGTGHYYFIKGKAFLIEFDNTQNNANHIHTVWRDYDGDWGKDMIRDHYKNSDHHEH